MADTEPKKRVRRTKEEAQRVILDAAEERLANGGPEALRLQDIAADVGISHPAILHHFDYQSRSEWGEADDHHVMNHIK